MATFVLVHGAWHGGWCWRAVADLLEAEGHKVYAPTLTGLADRSHLLAPDISLDTHIHDVANLIAWEELSDVVLCGHSYGGMVVTGAADAVAHKLHALVYLDAFVPKNGESLESYAAPERLAHMHQQAKVHGEGWKVPPMPVSIWLDDPAQQEWVEPKVTPHPLKCMTEPISLTGAHATVANKHYILAAANTPSAFHPFHWELSSEPDWACHAIDGPHDLMISHPEETADLLLTAAD